MKVKNKRLIGGMILAAAIIIGLVVTQKPAVLKDKAVKTAQPAANKAAKVAASGTVKKAISKGKGGLTIKIVDSKNKEMALRATSFKSQSANSSIYTNSFITNRMAELLPGNYDIEIATTPPALYKNIKVVMGEENVEKIGSITGSINVKALDARMKPASYPIRVMYPKTNDIVTGTVSNRPIEIISGTYDVEIGTLPRQIKTDVKVDAGKETLMDLGCVSGTLAVKALDENKKEVRAAVRVTKFGTSELIASGAANRPMDIAAGSYSVSLVGAPEQEKKDIKINSGEESVVEFSVKTPPPPMPKPASVKKTG